MNNNIIWTRGPAIGRGSSAAVYVAASADEVFAVKSAEIARSSILQYEQSILSSLDCPHIISYLGFQQTPLHYNLFIELAANGSLADHSGCIGEEDIRAHAGDILSGLAYLHSRRIVHCDVKGANVLIGSDGRAKLADFGCAKRVDDDEGMPLQVRGTPMFMAPEVARGEEQGLAADVWAVGCTVIEMATGGPAWPSLAAESDPIAALHRIGFSSAEPELPGWISEEGKDFLRKCLVRDPEKRWTAERLLKHPFVAAQENCVEKFDQIPMWRSPKSTLDREMWESTTEEEEEKEEQVEEHQSSDIVRQRILQLVGSCNISPNWTWDGSWFAIRSGDEEECSTATISEDCSTKNISEECSTATTSADYSIEILEEATTTWAPIPIARIGDVSVSGFIIDYTEINLSESRDYYSYYDNGFNCVSECEDVNEKRQEFSCLRYMTSFMNETGVSENYKFDIFVLAVFLLSLCICPLSFMTKAAISNGHQNDRRPRLSKADFIRFC